MKQRPPSVRFILKDSKKYDTAHAAKLTIHPEAFEAVDAFLLEADNLERSEVEAKVKELTPRGNLITTKIRDFISPEAAQDLALKGHTVLNLGLEPEVVMALLQEHDAAHGTAAFAAAIKGNKGQTPKHEELALLLGTRTHANIQGNSHMVARAAQLPCSDATVAMRAACCLRTGVNDENIDYVLAMLGIPGGLGNRVHADGPQHNLAVMVAFENETEATRFLDPGDLRPSMRGGVELERLARGKKWTDLPVGRLLRAGECVLFSTRWWHAGPGQAQGAGFRRVIFLPLTGGTKDRKGKSEHVRLPRQNI
jgi:hypothetical protein